MAALVSMKSNGLEEGEVRETHRAEKNNTSMKTRLSNADRQQAGTGVFYLYVSIQTFCSTSL